MLVTITATAGSTDMGGILWAASVGTDLVTCVRLCSLNISNVQMDIESTTCKSVHSVVQGWQEVRLMQANVFILQQ